MNSASPIPLRTQWIGLLVAVFAVGAGFVSWRLWTTPNPPAVPPVDDEEVRTFLESVRREVVSAPSAKTWGKLGLSFMANRCLAEAEASFVEAEKLDGKDYRWPLYQAVFLKNRDLSLAASKFRKACSHPSAPVAAYVHWGDVLLAAGRSDEAAEAFEKIRAVHPADPYANLGLARLALARNAFDVVQEHLFAIGSKKRIEKAAMQIEAELAFRRGRTKDAAAISQKARMLPDDPLPPEPWLTELPAHKAGLVGRLTKAEGKFIQGEVSEAIADMEDIIKAYPKASVPWQYLGKFRMTRALERRAAAVESDPDFQGGIAAFRRASEAAPNDPDPFMLEGLAWLDSNSPEGIQNAAKALRRSNELLPGRLPVVLALAHSFNRLGDSRAEIQTLEEGLGFRPDDVELHKRVATARLFRGEPLLAVRSISALTRLAPADPALPRLKALTTFRWLRIVPFGW